MYSYLLHFGCQIVYAILVTILMKGLNAYLPNDIYIKEVFICNKRKKGYVFSHQDLINAERIRFILMN